MPPTRVDATRPDAVGLAALPRVGRVSGDVYYEELGEGRYRPTIHVQGAWNDDEQHMSPVAGLLAHAVEVHDPRPELQLSRITYDILGFIPLAQSHVRVRTLRPGRTIELVEATMEVAGRDVVRATAWRLRRQDTTAVEGGQIPPLPGPDVMPLWGFRSVWVGGYIATMHGRRDEDSRPGRAKAWIRSDVHLLDGEAVSPTAQFLRLVDTANGIATREDPRQWVFPNIDLTVHLLRQPEGEWVGFDTTVSFGPSGLGLTSSWLHDQSGPVGRVEQALTVRPNPEPA